MEKLIMLLDIYEEQVVGVHSVGDKRTEKDECRICSKKFGFIKWLAENKKIGYEKLNELNDRYRCLEPYEAIVMQLSVSDNPIQDLISLLK